MKLKIKLDPGAYMPTRAHRTDAGLDLYATERKLLWPVCLLRLILAYILPFLRAMWAM